MHLSLGCHEAAHYKKSPDASPERKQRRAPQDLRTLLFLFELSAKTRSSSHFPLRARQLAPVRFLSHSSSAHTTPYSRLSCSGSRPAGQPQALHYAAAVFILEQPFWADGSSGRQHDVKGIRRRIHDKRRTVLCFSAADLVMPEAEIGPGWAQKAFREAF